MHELHCTEGIINVSSNQFGISGLHRTRCTEPIYVFCFLCFKPGPSPIQLFRRMLPHRFVVKLQKCFVDYETSPDIPSALIDNVWIFIFVLLGGKSKSLNTHSTHPHVFSLTFFLLIGLRTVWTFSTNRKSTGVTNNTDGVLIPLKFASKSRKCDTDIYIYLLHPCFTVVSSQNVSCEKRLVGT